MKSCFGYIRVSTPKQGEGVSLEVQKDDIAKAALERGLNIVDWFVELETAAKTGRPVFNAMAGKLKRGQAEALMVHKLDRSSRNMTDWGAVSRLMDQGIEFHIATEHIDFTTRSGRFTADMLAAIAADFSRNQREETKKGLRGRLKQGLFPYRSPLGYLAGGRGKPKPPCPETGPIVARMFDLYATGDHSYESLRHEAHRLGLRNHNGGMISLHGMEKMLSNPFYYGTIRIERTGETFQGIHEPLIDKGLFDKVQSIRRTRSGAKVTRHEHLFVGLFRCSLCNAPLVPELQRGHVYYRCHLRTCTMTSMREDRLDREIRAELARLELTREAADEMVRSWKASDLADELPMQRRSIIAKIEDRETKKARLADLLLEATIDMETHKLKRDEMDFELSQLRLRLEELPDPQSVRRERGKFLNWMSNLVHLYDGSDRAGKRQLLRETFSRRLADKSAIKLELEQWANAKLGTGKERQLEKPATATET